MESSAKVYQQSQPADRIGSSFFNKLGVQKTVTYMPEES